MKIEKTIIKNIFVQSFHTPGKHCFYSNPYIFPDIDSFATLFLRTIDSVESNFLKKIEYQSNYPELISLFTIQFGSNETAEMTSFIDKKYLVYGSVQEAIPIKFINFPGSRQYLSLRKDQFSYGLVLSFKKYKNMIDKGYAREEEIEKLYRPFYGEMIEVALDDEEAIIQEFIVSDLKKNIEKWNVSQIQYLCKYINNLKIKGENLREAQENADKKAEFIKLLNKFIDDNIDTHNHSSETPFDPYTEIV